MRGLKRHARAFASALAITGGLTLVLASSVAGAGPAVAHRVSAGGPDACEGHGLPPGCDGSYALVAVLYQDGTASGRYVDRFATGNGIVGVVDCVVVVGNEAWVSGWVTSGSSDGDDLAGLPFTTLLVDNGTSAKDPPDQVSTSHVGDPTPCTEMVAWDLFDMPQGQVTIN
jgi:hypothetical protein